LRYSTAELDRFTKKNRASLKNREEKKAEARLSSERNHEHNPKPFDNSCDYITILSLNEHFIQ
jgi:hypothetical protein